MYKKHTFLFLQGHVSFFTRHLASYLEQQGVTCLRINLCFSDWLCWLGKPSVNYREKIDQWPDFLRDYLRKNNVTTILYYKDCFPYHRIARKIADDLGIDTVTYENGYLRPNWLTVEKGGMSRYSHFPADPDDILVKGSNLPVFEQFDLPSVKFRVEAFWEVVYHLGNYLFHWTFHNYHSDRHYNPLFEYLSYIPRLLKSKKADNHAVKVINELLQSEADYWLFPLQLQSDYQLRENSPFEHQSEAMERVIRNFSKFAKEDEKLLFKIHPLDNGIEPWDKILADLGEKYQVSERLLFIDGGNLQKLINHCKGVFTINSTVGLHSLQAMKPVFVLGCAVYDIKGLASDQSLAEFFKDPAQPDEKLLEAFIKLLAASIQIQGNYYTRQGKQVAIKALSDMLINEQVNCCGAYVSSPQRNTEKCQSHL